jgi:hypothetical protein
VVPHEFYEVPQEETHHPTPPPNHFIYYTSGAAWAWRGGKLDPRGGATCMQLYLGVAALLSAKRPLSFALCKYCARKCALTWEGKLLCWYAPAMLSCQYLRACRVVCAVCVCRGCSWGGVGNDRHCIGHAPPQDV